MTTLLALPPALVLSGDRLRDPEAAARLEWFESDGRGGGAAGTAVGAATRREHGLLLVAGDAPRASVHLLLARFEERILGVGDGFEPGVNFYPDAVHPRGDLRLRSFALDPWPCWSYDLGGAALVREVLVSRAAHSTIVRWRLSGAAGTLELRPLIAARSAHELASPAGLRGDAIFGPRSLEIAPRRDLPPIALSFESAEWSAQPDVYHATVHPRDHGRADGDREDLFCPGVLRLPLVRDRWVAIVCGTAPVEPYAVPELVAAELLRRESVAARGRGFSCDDVPLHLPARLALAADAWVVRRSGGRGVMAGFPALRESTDGALGALPGLCVATGQLREAAAVLHAFVRHGFARGEPAADTASLLRYVLAAAAVAERGVASGELWPTVRRALETCAARAGPRGFGGGGEMLNELWHAALLCGRAFAPDHPAAVRFGSVAARLRESRAAADAQPTGAFPVVPYATGPMLLDPARLAAAVLACDAADGGVTAALPAARLDDYARAHVRLDGAAARPRLRALLEHAAAVVEHRGLGQVPERLTTLAREGHAVADSGAVAALISICALLASLSRPAAVARHRDGGYIARPWKP